MNKKIIFAASIIALMILPSCKSVYKCGDPKPAKADITWGKRLKQVIKERDALCERISENDSTINSLNRRLDSLNTKIKKQNADIDSLTSLYNRLSDAKLNDAQRYDMAMRQKSDEIAAKEKEIAEREKALQEMHDALQRKDAAADTLNQSIKNALKGFKNDELQVTEKDGKVYISLSNNILFASGSATVNDKGHDALKALAEVLKKNQNIDIQVEGHTDSDPYRIKPGTDTHSLIVRDNWDLSVIRATSIVKILTDEYGVNPKQVTAAGRGEFFPKADNTTAEGRSANRRTEIILSPKLDEVMNLINKK